MKNLSILFCVLFSFCAVAPVFATESLTNQIMENASGDQIMLLDAPSSDEQSPQVSDWQAKTQEILINAMSLTGIKYKYGGNSPSTGFDCSGFVRYVFSQAVNLALPPTARAISQIGKTVRKDELQPGDLVFFNTLKSAFSHVGIYIGDNKFIHAPRKGAAVRVENMHTSYWESRFDGAQRLEDEAEKSTNVAQKTGQTP
ncbi:MAG: C40 family peptidase [Methylophilaceae bacterium]